MVEGLDGTQVNTEGKLTCNQQVMMGMKSKGQISGVKDERSTGPRDLMVVAGVGRD